MVNRSITRTYGRYQTLWDEHGRLFRSFIDIVRQATDAPVGHSHTMKLTLPRVARGRVTQCLNQSGVTDTSSRNTSEPTAVPSKKMTTSTTVQAAGITRFPESCVHVPGATPVL